MKILFASKYLLCYILKLVIIIDYGSAFVLFYEHDICTKKRLKETKASPRESTLLRPRCPNKINRGG